MCGIVGLYRRDEKPVADEDLRRLGAVIAHRGPDDERVWTNGGIGLLTHRFSLEDIPGGNQPATYEHITVAWNGEIFNWRELAERFDLSDVTGDTTLLPRLFAKLGDEALPLFNGQFAIAVWNQQERRLLLARDPAGILPLHFVDLGHEVVFASELRALLEWPAIEKEADWEAMAHYFRMGFFAAPFTPFAKIRQLRPGCAVVFEPERSMHHRFYRPVYTQDYAGSPDQAAMDLIDLMMDATRRRLSESSPQGLFLSGGVDSALMAAVLQRANISLPSFTVGFFGQGDLKQYHFTESFERPREVFNEFAEADATCFNLGWPSPQHIVADDESLTQKLSDIARWLDTPCMSISAPPLFFLTGEAAKSIRVAHSGGGADELFAGYAHVDPSHYRDCTSVVGRYLELTQIFSPKALAAIGSPLAGSAAAISELLPQQVTDSADVETETLSFVLAAERIGPLPQNILQKNDRIGMRMPLEMRYPYLDHQVVDFAQRLPESLLVDKGEGKLVIKTAAELLGLPPEVTRRKKVRLQAPYATYLDEPRVERFFKSIIAAPPAFPERPYDPQKAVEMLFGVNAKRVWRRPAKVLLLATWNLWASRLVD